eukprot:4087864-Pyramimonas_sp.AAC.1
MACWRPVFQSLRVPPPANLTARIRCLRFRWRTKRLYNVALASLRLTRILEAPAELSIPRFVALSESSGPAYFPNAFLIVCRSRGFDAIT